MVRREVVGQMGGSLTIVPLTDRLGARAAGEIGLRARTEWRDVLERLTRQDGDVYLELSGITFVDVAAARSSPSPRSGSAPGGVSSWTGRRPRCGGRCGSSGPT